MMSAPRDDGRAAYFASVLDAYGLAHDPSLPEHLATLSDAAIPNELRLSLAKDEAAFLEKTVIVTAKEITGAKAATVVNPAKEARALAHACAAVYGLSDELGRMEARRLIEEIGPVLDALTDTSIFGRDRVSLFLTAAMQSKLMREKMGFTLLEATDSAASIAQNAKEKNYGSLMNSLSLYVGMMDAVQKETLDVNAAVEAMLKDLSAESTDVIKVAMTPNVVKYFGVPEASAEPAANLLASTFDGLIAAKEQGMSEEDYKRESDAISDMLNLATAASGQEQGDLFGEESALGRTAEDYLDCVLSSDVMSKAIVDASHDDAGNLILDPLNTGRELSDEDLARFEDAVDAAWEASEKDAQTEQTLRAIGSLLGTRVTLG